MIEYIVKDNIDDRVLDRASRIMRDGGLVAHPTDTTWHISTTVHSRKGIQRLKKLKGGIKNYTLTLILNNINQITMAASLSTPQFKLINRLTPGPYVFILEAHRKVEKTLGMKRREIGVRIPRHPVPLALAAALNEPLWSITASRRMEDKQWWDSSFAEQMLFEGGWELGDISEIDMIMDTGESLPKILTTVLDLSEEDAKIVREGAGKW